MRRAAPVWYERIPAARRDPPGTLELLRVRLFPPSYRTVPWPIPDDWGREWQRRAYLRSIGVAPTGPRGPSFRDVAIAVLACAATVAILTATSRVWAWGHL